MTRGRFFRMMGALILTVAPVARAADYYVDAGNTSGTEDGSQQSPFRTVQAAIDAAANGDVIRVAGGTYVEILRIQGKALALEGGYTSDWIRDIASNTTTLSGAGGNAVINIIEADALIDGFRITGGTGSTEELPNGYHGGGIYSRDGSPTISNNTIEGNDIRNNVPPDANYHFGGGIHVTNAATVTIMNNVVRGNFAGRGAGLSVVNVQVALIQDNTIEDNVAIGDHGGGMFIAALSATITQNVIRRNEVGRELSYGWGGGLIVVNQGNSAAMSFNEVYENYAAAYGAGIFIDEGAEAVIEHELIYGNVSRDGCEAVSAISVDGGYGADGVTLVGSQATINHCTVVGNVCPNSTRGNGLQVEGLSTVNVTNSIFWNNGGDDFAVDGTSALSVMFSDSQEGFAGTGNISADPLFVNEATNDFRLSAGSPCIDAADPAAPFDNEPAPNGGRADMGRFGNASDDPSTGGGGGGGGGSGGGGSGNGTPPPAPPRRSLFCGALGPAVPAMLLGMSLLSSRRARWCRRSI